MRGFAKPNSYLKTIDMKLNLPDGWHEVTIEQYQEISNTDGDDKLIDVVAILADEDPEEIRKIDADSLPVILNQIAWIKSLPEEGTFKPIIEIDGEKYGFINRLADLTVGEWIDLESWIGKSNENLHRIMSVLYRPLVSASNDNYRVIDKYVVSEAQDRAKLFRSKVNLGDVYGAMLFFSLIESEFLRIMPKYLKSRQEKMRNLPKWKKVLMAVRGCLLSIVWPKENSQKWMRFLDRIFSSRLTYGISRSTTNH